MITLFILAVCMFGLMAGYTVMHYGYEVRRHMVMNKFRKEVGLETKKYRNR